MENNQKIYKFYVLVSDDDLDNIKYVGVTTQSIQKRFYQHKYCAMHKEKRELPVYKWMYSKYINGNNVLIKQIDSCSENKWEETEQYWIKHYKELGFNLMNIDKGGRGVITKEKRSKSSLQRSIERHYKPIIALYKNGSFYKEYKSEVEAQLDLGFKSKSSISNVLKGINNSAGEYIFVYKEDYKPTEVYLYKGKIGNSVFCFDINGTLLKEYKNLSAFKTIKGLDRNNISKAIKNKVSYHNLFWSFTKTIDIQEYKIVK